MVIHSLHVHSAYKNNNPKGQPVCPSNRTIHLSLKKGDPFVPQISARPSKKETHLAPNQSNWFVPYLGYLSVPQKGQHICPSKRASHLSLKTDNLSVKKGNPFVIQKGDPQEG